MKDDTYFSYTLKRELVQDAHYDNPEQARMDIFKYIELYYNTKRIHSALGWLSPTLLSVFSGHFQTGGFFVSIFPGSEQSLPCFFVF